MWEEGSEKQSFQKEVKLKNLSTQYRLLYAQNTKQDPPGNHKSETCNKQEKKTKEVKHITKDSHQTTREESKRKRKEQRRTTKTPRKKVTKCQ